ncbi:hypothetical protein DPMN_053264 [Dreissena polymorpha]|uniref:Uncharacterized protein n=2 Tax=Dreissena polymorpha TaxID=45954 RepID=A0A9D4HNP0_DREPO|nr:hypothetical protein DPMN_053264 [Dreissena polymorpha]
MQHVNTSPIYSSGLQHLEHQDSYSFEQNNFIGSSNNMKKVTNHQDEPQLPSLSTVEPCNMFFTGYLDCAHEALRYLIEIEKLPTSHPLVLGIQCQLYEHYRLLQLQYMFENLYPAGQMVHIPNAFPNDVASGSLCEQCDTIAEDETIGLSTIGTHSINNGCLNSVDCALAPEHSFTQNSTGDILKNSGLPIESQKLAESLADEIYSLLHSTDDSDDDEFTDEESIDEGFEEMTELTSN